jgi:large subunit ribosomal protein L15
MRQHEITSVHARPTARRVGRGISSGQGKTAGRGTKGQKARTGANSNIPRTFEGGATPLIQRLPKKKGFTSHRTKPVTVNILRLGALTGAPVTMARLLEAKLISNTEALRGVKVVGSPIEGITFDTTDPKLKTSKKL